MNVKKILKILLEYLSLFSIIIVITAGIAQVLLMFKYNISMSYFQYNLVEVFPKGFFLTVIILVLFFPYIFLKDRNGLARIFIYIVVSILLSVVFVLYIITSLQYFMLVKFDFNLYTNNFALNTIILLIIIGCVSFANAVDCHFKNKNERSKIRRNLDLISFVLSALLLISVIYSSMYYFTLKNVPYENVVDIIEKDDQKYVLLVPYNDEFIVSKYSEKDDNINIDVSEHFLIDRSNCKIYKKKYIKVEYIK